MAELSLTLIAATAALGIAAIYWKDAKEDDRAVRAGHELAQMTNAVSEWMALNGRDDAVLPTGTTINRVGVNWLKPTTCPGGLVTNPANGFLPCDFGAYPGVGAGATFSTPMFSDYQASITRNGSSVRSTVSYIPVMPGNERNRLGYIAGVISKTAGSLGQRPSMPSLTSNRTFHSNVSLATATAGVPYQIPFNVATTADFGRVTAVISDQTNTDIWLRVDGGNSMQAALRMNGNDILDAHNIGADGTVVVTDGTPGNADGIVIADNVGILDATLPNGDNPMASQGVYYMSVISPGASVTKPTCPTGSTPQIFATPQSLKRSTGSTVYPIHAFDINVTDSGASWTVNARVLNSNVGWGNADADSKIMVSAKCL